jgi:transposase
MTAKAKARPPAAKAPAAKVRPATKPRPPVIEEAEDTQEAWAAPPATTEECLARIRTLGQRIEGHVDFISAIGKLPSTSTEAKQRAAAAFYDRLRALERMLGAIREELWLG